MWLFFFVILFNCRPPYSGGIAFDLPAGTWDISGCHRKPPCCVRHLNERHCTIWIKVRRAQFFSCMNTVDTTALTSASQCAVYVNLSSSVTFFEVQPLNSIYNNGQCLTLIVPSANSLSPLKIAIENRLIHAIHKNCIVYLFCNSL